VAIDVPEPHLPEDEQIGTVPMVFVASSTIKKITSTGSEVALRDGIVFISVGDVALQITSLAVNVYPNGTTPCDLVPCNVVNAVTLEAYATYNSVNSTMIGNNAYTSFAQSPAVVLPVLLRSVTAPPESPFVLVTEPSAIIVERPVDYDINIPSQYDIKIDLSSLMRTPGLYIGDATQSSPFTVYLVLKSIYTTNAQYVVNSLPVSSVMPIEFNLVNSTAVEDGRECTCYMDTYTGPTPSVVFAGCTPEIAANACYNGLSYNMTYYYTIFTYNDAGHFSIADNNNQAVFGMTNSNPPGAVYGFASTFESATQINTLQWTNPAEDNLYGFRIYVSQSIPCDLASGCLGGRFAENFVETNSVAYDPAIPETGCNMFLVYDTLLTRTIDLASPHISKMPGDTSSFKDGHDNSSNGNRIVFELSADGKQLLTPAGKAFNFISGATYYYTIFTYDVYGSYNAPVCVTRNAIVIP
jgi:hypothetical protein